jgi:hypothetical protein
MTTPGQVPGRVGQERIPAAGEPTGRGAGARPGWRAVARSLVVAASVVGLGVAAGSWATPAVDEAAPDELIGTMHGLPPGHPPVGIIQRLPPGHPPLGTSPRLPAGHPPIPSAPPPARLDEQLGMVTI